MKFLEFLVLSSLLLSISSAHAWGKRGHQIIGEEAALLVSSEKSGEFLKSKSFDLGYYNNIPDSVWKRAATYELEFNEHFMDLEIFAKAFKDKADITKPFDLSREEFEQKFPAVEKKAGRAYWRIRELNDRLSDVTKQLRDLPDSQDMLKARQALQEKWLVTAGTMGHYIADLSQPLHVTENYDGQMTNQKGVHSHFEDLVVDELYPGFRSALHDEAMKRWPAFKKRNEKKSLQELLEGLADVSAKRLKPLLDLDKKTKRFPAAASAKANRKLMTESMVDGSLYFAEILRRQLGWKFDGNRFFFFAGEPEYIAPGAFRASNASPTTGDKK